MLYPGTASLFCTKVYIIYLSVAPTKAILQQGVNTNTFYKETLN